MINRFNKPDSCPYCGYKVNDATMIGDETKLPSKGDLSFCMMCAGSLEFNNNLKLIKFDLNSIEDIVERNRIKLIQHKINEFWDDKNRSPEEVKRRNGYLYNIDKKNM